MRILDSDQKALASWLPFISFILSWLHLGFLLSEAKGEKLEANIRNFQRNSTVINEIYHQSIFSSIIGFTLNGLVFVRILDSESKPLASSLPFISIILPITSNWLLIVRSQK